MSGPYREAGEQPHPEGAKAAIATYHQALTETRDLLTWLIPYTDSTSTEALDNAIAKIGEILDRELNQFAREALDQARLADAARTWREKCEILEVANAKLYRDQKGRKSEIRRLKSDNERLQLINEHLRGGMGPIARVGGAIDRCFGFSRKATDD